MLYNLLNTTKTARFFAIYGMVWEYCNCYYVAMGYFPLR